MRTDWTGTGWLRVRSYASDSAVPVGGAHVRVLSDGGATVLYEGDTDENGILENMALPCPPRELSLSPEDTEPPYGTYSLTASCAGYADLTLENFEAFDGETSEANLTLEPEDVNAADSGVAPLPDVTEVPEHVLYAGDGGSGKAPLETCPIAQTLVLQEIIIPSSITVHLGKPSASAQNVTVSFSNYIKNVASSEVYPTWPEQALRANIHAQISLALNRIYTEWYRSKGYSFDITNSTAYDQYYGTHSCLRRLQQQNDFLHPQ